MSGIETGEVIKNLNVYMEQTVLQRTHCLINELGKKNYRQWVQPTAPSYHSTSQPGFSLLEPACWQDTFSVSAALSSRGQAPSFGLDGGVVCDLVSKFNSGMNITLLIMTAHLNHIIHIYFVTTNKTDTYLCACISYTLFLNCFRYKEVTKVGSLMP